VQVLHETWAHRGDLLALSNPHTGLLASLPALQRRILDLANDNGNTSQSDGGACAAAGAGPAAARAPAYWTATRTTFCAFHYLRQLETLTCST
jgi:hypothetical protein